MAFKPGSPKPPGSGRKKGQKNKKPTMLSIRAQLAELDVNPTQLLRDLLNRAEQANDMALEFDVLRVMLQYSYAPPKDSLPDYPADDDGALDKLSKSELLQLVTTQPKPEMS